MSEVLQAIERFATTRGNVTALEGDATRLSYAALRDEIQLCSHRLQSRGITRLGLLMDNCPAWAVIDLAALAMQIVLVPLPAFFSDEQLLHVIKSAGLDGVLCDQPGRVTRLLPMAQMRPWPRIAGQDIWHIETETTKVNLPPETAKITFTSGTTGEPKGVCLSDKTICAVANSIADLIDVQSEDKHLSLLPLAVLLENVAGLYAALLRGVPCSLPSLTQLGGNGANRLDARTMFENVQNANASSIILIPEMLQAMLAVAQQGMTFPALRFAAVGGASVALQLLEQAKSQGLPVFEGYGLSECASVVAVNTESANRIGSVGKVLSHNKVQVADDGEVLIKGPRYLGYLNESFADSNAWLSSGDIGHLDDDGYLYITGRKKNVYITSFGRNVSPEWVERELLAQPGIAQAVVFGESLPWSTAVVVPRSGVEFADIEASIQQVNHHLPEYASVGQWLMADEVFSADNQQYTANGRPRRDVIWNHYKDRINQLYSRHESIA